MIAESINLGSQDYILTKLLRGIQVKQSFIAEYNYLERIHIVVGTYHRRNTCSMSITIQGEDGIPIEKKVIDCMNLADNSYVDIPLNCFLDEGKKYFIILHSSNGTAGNSIALKYNMQKSKNGDLIVSNKNTMGELCCRLDFKQINEISDIKRFEKQQPFEGNGDYIDDFLNINNRKLSVIILNKDNFKIIKKCINSLLIALESLDYEIIIGDIGTVDKDVLEYYKEIENERIRVIYNLEYRYSNNINELVKKYSTGDFLLFLNNNVCVEKESISRMLSNIMCYTVGAVGLRLMGERVKINHDGKILYNGFNFVIPHDINTKKIIDEENDVVDGVIRDCLLTRRHMFLSLEGFDEGYKETYQDCDYCANLLLKGFYNVIVRTSFGTYIEKRENLREKEDEKRYINKWNNKKKPICDYQFSFITCVNNKKVYWDMLNSINKNIYKIELVPILGYFGIGSIPRALNIGNKCSSGKILVYCHQDVIYNKMFLVDVFDYLNKYNMREMGIVGFEGIQHNGIPCGCRFIKKYQSKEAQTIDELCIVLKDRSMKFNEDLKYHFYGADICLEARRRGKKIYVIGTVVRHLSDGKDNVQKDPSSFLNDAYTFRNKWREVDSVITTTSAFRADNANFTIWPSLNSQWKFPE